MSYIDVDTDTLKAEAITEELIQEHNPQILEEVLKHLGKRLRRIAIQRFLEEEKDHCQ